MFSGETVSVYKVFNADPLAPPPRLQHPRTPARGRPAGAWFLEESGDGTD